MKKHLLLGLVSITFFGNAFSQQDEPPTYWGVQEFCKEKALMNGCNYISNPKFKLKYGPVLPYYVSVFNTNRVVNWGATSSATMDIDGGALYGSPAPPVMPAPLAGTSYASGYITHQSPYQPTLYGESIVTQIPALQRDASYNISYLFAATENPDWTAQFGGLASFEFKIILTHCQNFDITSQYNQAPYIYNYPMVLSGNSQVISCQPFTNLGNYDWHQELGKFIAEDDYDMLIVYPEIDPSSNLGNSYFHFGMPEIFRWEDPQITVTPDLRDPCYKTLSVCGPEAADYTWFNPRGAVIGTGRSARVLVNLTGNYYVKVSRIAKSLPASACNTQMKTLAASINLTANRRCEPIMEDNGGLSIGGKLSIATLSGQLAVNAQKNITGIAIYSADGRLLKQTKENAQQCVVDLKLVPAGLYILIVTFQDGTKSIEKLLH